MYLLSDYTAETDRGRIERRPRHESEGVFRWPHHRGIYLDGKSVGSLEADVGGLAASGRYVASSQEIETGISSASDEGRTGTVRSLRAAQREQRRLLPRALTLQVPREFHVRILCHDVAMFLMMSSLKGSNACVI